MRAAAAVAVLATLLAVTGCSSDPGPKSVPEISTPSPAMPSPKSTLAPAAPVPTPTSPAPLSREQAAKRYLAIVEPYNVALERLEKAINGGRPLATQRARAGEVAATNAIHMRQLGATPWPAAVRAPVRELLDESARAQVYWRRAARAETRAGLIQAAQKAIEHDGSEAAAKIRRLLGLRKYNEDNY